MKEGKLCSIGFMHQLQDQARGKGRQRPDKRITPPLELRSYEYYLDMRYPIEVKDRAGVESALHSSCNIANETMPLAELWDTE